MVSKVLNSNPFKDLHNAFESFVLQDLGVSMQRKFIPILVPGRSAIISLPWLSTEKCNPLAYAFARSFFSTVALKFLLFA